MDCCRNELDPVRQCNEKVLMRLKTSGGLDEPTVLRPDKSYEIPGELQSDCDSILNHTPQSRVFVKVSIASGPKILLCTQIW